MRRFCSAISAASLNERAEGLLWVDLNENFGFGANVFLVSSSLSCKALMAYGEVVSAGLGERGSDRWHGNTSAYVLWS